MNNDLISRSELKKRLQEHKDFFINAYGGRHNFITNAPKDIKVRVDELNNCIAEVVNAPTVTPDKIQAIMSDYLIYRCEPKRPQGEWEESHIFSCGKILRMGLNVIEHKCKNCGRWSIKWERTISDNFCSNCGADMRGEKK